MGNLTYSYDANGRGVGKGGSLASIVMPQTVTRNAFNAANEMTLFNGTPLALAIYRPPFRWTTARARQQRKPSKRYRVPSRKI